jgi:hypothetical protein
MKMRHCAGAVILALVWAGVPAAWGQDALGQLEKSLDVPLVPPETATQAETAGGHLGMSVDLAAPNGNAVFVTAVAEGGPAQRGGLQADDVIVTINDTPIQSIDDMDRAVRKPAGTKLVFQVRRAEVVRRFEVTLGARPAAEAPSGTVAELPAPAPARAGGSAALEGSRPSLGISVVDVTDLTRRRFGVTVNNGAVITQIREGSPAARAGLPLGGVIVSVNGKRIASANDIVELIQAFRPGEEIEITYFEGDRVGRKKMPLMPAAPAAVLAPAPSTPSAMTTDPSDPPLRLGRRRPGGRPILEALERTLNAVLPPADAPGGGGDVADAPPPPPAPSAESGDHGDDFPVPPPPPARGKTGARTTPGIAEQSPSPPLPEDVRSKSVLKPSATVPPPDTDEELTVLRRQMETLKQQIEQLQRRIDELEQRNRG